MSARVVDVSAADAHARAATPLTLFEGLPGSGKSKRLIELVNAARAAGQPALTFACSDAAWMLLSHGHGLTPVLACRESGLACELDHHVTSLEAGKILERVPPGTLVAFEEAHCFAPAITEHWKAAARRGVELFICAPSPAQKSKLGAFPRRETNFIVVCQHCQNADATRWVIPPRHDAPIAICGVCYEAVGTEARRAILRSSQLHPHNTVSPLVEPGPAVLPTASRHRIECMERVIRDSVHLAEAVRQCVPSGVRVLVVSKGDPWSLRLDGPCGVHFPADRTGIYRGYDPADSGEAISLLDEERRNGAQFIVFPSSTAWWLDFYDDLHKHLEQHDKRIWRDVNCVIYQLTSAGCDARPAKQQDVNSSREENV